MIQSGLQSGIQSGLHSMIQSLIQSERILNMENKKFDNPTMQKIWSTESFMILQPLSYSVSNYIASHIRFSLL